MKEETNYPGGKFQTNPPEEFTNVINSLAGGNLSERDKVVPSFCAAIRDLRTVYVLVPLDKVGELCDSGHVPTILTRQGESTSILVSTTETMARQLMCVGLLMRLKRVVELALENEIITDLCIFGSETTPIHISRPTLQKCLDAMKVEKSKCEENYYVQN